MVFIVKSKLRNKQEIKMAKTKEISFKLCSNLSGKLLHVGGILCLFAFQKKEQIKMSTCRQVNLIYH